MHARNRVVQVRRFLKEIGCIVQVEEQSPIVLTFNLIERIITSKVRELRLGQNMTQASLIGEEKIISRSYLAGIENRGRSRVSRGTGTALARALGIELSEIQLEVGSRGSIEANPIDQLSKYLGVFQRHLAYLSQDINNIQGVLRQINSQEKSSSQE